MRVCHTTAPRRRAVSASDTRKYMYTPPLQDNLLLAYEALRERLPPRASALLHASFKHEWISIKEKLVALIALGFAAVFDEARAARQAQARSGVHTRPCLTRTLCHTQLPFSGFGMCTRTVACISCARAIRTAAFLLTVVPSPRPGCYAGRFPPVPDNALDFLRIGFGKLRSGGGCNDLILSGHGVIYSAVVVAFSDFYPGAASKLLWFALIRSNIRVRLS